MSTEAICENKRWGHGAPSEDARGVRRSVPNTRAVKDGRKTHHAADASLLEFQAFGVLERAEVYVTVVRHVCSACVAQAHESVRCLREVSQPSRLDRLVVSV